MPTSSTACRCTDVLLILGAVADDVLPPSRLLECALAGVYPTMLSTTSAGLAFAAATTDDGGGGGRRQGLVAVDQVDRGAAALTGRASA